MALCRELTKLHEEVLRGTAEDIRHILAGRETVKGEIVLVIAPPAGEPAVVSENQIEVAITVALQDNSSAKAASIVSKASFFYMSCDK